MFDSLNPAQRTAVEHRGGPLLVLAGAGTGKTTTLAARVASLVADGVAPERILLLTFTRRAAGEMRARAAAMLADVGGGSSSATGRVVGGTFHAIANQLLRRHAEQIGLPVDFGLLDAADAADLMDLVRDDVWGQARTTSTGSRLPRKDALMSIYGRVVNAQQPVAEIVAEHVPWCTEHVDRIGELFRAYSARKRQRNLLDYDDLLLFWKAMAVAPGVGDALGDAFDHVLVDEYQDTNALQADIVAALRRTNGDVTVVGDDAQAVYGFRAATVDNILRFGDRFPGTTIVRLEQNYRSTQPILDTANAVTAEMHAAIEQPEYLKILRSQRPDGPRPRLHTCHDEEDQSIRVCEAVLARREAGTPLQRQAVLFRTGHHSAHLELELSRRNIPFVKFGGLKFLEAAHVKDVLALLRLLDNGADELSWFRLLQRVEGVGPGRARQITGWLADGPPDRAAARLRDLDDGGAGGGCAGGEGLGDAGAMGDEGRADAAPPGLPAEVRARLGSLGAALTDAAAHEMVAAAMERLATWYRDVCADAFDDHVARMADVDQLTALAADRTDRTAFLDDLVLDPPASTGDLAGPPHLDEDYLILSTIHSAKGLEWDTVHLLHASDGMIPSDMSTGTREGVEEERRLLYVALTRPRFELDVYVPLRYYHQRFGGGDRHSYGQISRFLQGAAKPTFDRRGPVARSEPVPVLQGGITSSVDGILDALW